MKTNFVAVRAMIKQSALIAANAACVTEEERSILTHAAGLLVQRALDGPEMEKMHMQPVADMNTQAHTNLHNAGEAVLDFLDSIEIEGNNISCQQTIPVSIAASSAMLRETNSATKEFQESIVAILQRQNHALLLPQVRALALALQQL